MIKLGGIITRSAFGVNEASDDKYVHIGYGKFKEKGKEKDTNAPTFKKDGDKYVPTGNDTVKGGDDSPDDGKPKVNIFDKPKETEPTKEPEQTPTKDSTQQRAGNPKINKDVRTLAKKIGITPQKLGGKEYQKQMVQAAVSALQDANYSDEARSLVADLENKPEWKQKPDYSKAGSMADPDYRAKADAINKNSAYSSEYMNPSDEVDNFGRIISKVSKWDANDVVDSIAFDLKMNGYKALASKIQSLVESKKSTKLTSLIKK